MSTNNLKEAVNHNTYNAPVTINNYYVSPVPPEEPPVVPAKRNVAGFLKPPVFYLAQLLPYGSQCTTG
jgi:hypothetical protein